MSRVYLRKLNKGKRNNLWSGFEMTVFITLIVFVFSLLLDSRLRGNDNFWDCSKMPRCKAREYRGVRPTLS